MRASLGLGLYRPPGQHLNPLIPTLPLGTLGANLLGGLVAGVTTAARLGGSLLLAGTGILAVDRFGTAPA